MAFLVVIFSDFKKRENLMTEKQWFWNLLFILFVLLKALLVQVLVIQFTVIKFKVEIVINIPNTI